jgi:hypothetical protein
MANDFVPASKFLRDAEFAAPVSATIADLAAHHIISTCPLWARSKSVEGLLGCVIRYKAWLTDPVTRPLNKRQTMEAIKC